MENGDVQQTPVWEKLRHYIDDVAGISRKQFAYNLGVSESQVSLMLSGKRKIDLEEYIRICNVLAVRADRFLIE